MDYSDYFDFDDDSYVRFYGNERNDDTASLYGSDNPEDLDKYYGSELERYVDPEKYGYEEEKLVETHTPIDYATLRGYKFSPEEKDWSKGWMKDIDPGFASRGYNFSDQESAVLTGLPLAQYSNVIFKDGVNTDNLSSSVINFLNLCELNGIKLRVSSGYREGATTSNGNKSRHGSGLAIDVTPVDGSDFETLIKQMASIPAIRNYIDLNNGGVFDERSSATLATTGGTGAHLHVSFGDHPEQVGKRDWENFKIKYPLAAQPTGASSASLRLFIQLMAAAYKSIGITNPEVIRTLIAQDAFETGWGAKTVGKYNYGNIKAFGWSGPTATATDKTTGSTDKYRSYNSAADYARDKWNLLRTKYDITNDDNSAAVISKLQGNNKSKYRYAESTSYELKLNEMLNQILI